MDIMDYKRPKASHIVPSRQEAFTNNALEFIDLMGDKFRGAFFKYHHGALSNADIIELQDKLKQ